MTLERLGKNDLVLSCRRWGVIFLFFFHPAKQNEQQYISQIAKRDKVSKILPRLQKPFYPLKGWSFRGWARRVSIRLSAPHFTTTIGSFPHNMIRYATLPSPTPLVKLFSPAFRFWDFCIWVEKFFKAFVCQDPALYLFKVVVEI